jgi:cobyrinic acid a,c-diamide synthase
VPFSPVHDRALPPGCSGVLLPGTATSLTPHVLAQLTVNAPMRAALAAFCAAGGPVLTESAGLVYLCQKAAVQEGGQEGGLEQGLVRSAPSVPLGE